MQAGPFALASVAWLVAYGIAEPLSELLAHQLLGLPRDGRLEFIPLRRVLRPKLLGAFIDVVSAGILLVGFLFNAVL